MPSDGQGAEADGYRTIVADPPWPFRDRLPGHGRGAAKHYRLMELHEIQRLPMPPLAPDARLFLWRVASMQEEALAVMRSWGFEPKAEIVWVKMHGVNLLHMGMGRQVRNSHETCLIGVRGRPERLSRDIRSVFMAPIGVHSEKPNEFYDIVERLSPGPYLELFARRQRPGWTCIGDEMEAR